MSKILNKFVLGSVALYVAFFATVQNAKAEFGYGGGGSSAPSYTDSVSAFVSTSGSGHVTSGSITNNSTLSLDGGSRAVRMAISYDPTFAGISQEPYATTKTWNVLPGKPIYVRFFDAAGAFADTVINGNSSTGQVLGVKISRVDDLISSTKFRAKNNNVKLLQMELKKAGFYPKGYVATGYYGPITKAAVAKYLASLK